MAPGARDEFKVDDVSLRSRALTGGASVESLQSWGAALYVMAPGNRLHDSHCEVFSVVRRKPYKPFGGG